MWDGSHDAQDDKDDGDDDEGNYWDDLTNELSDIVNYWVSGVVGRSLIAKTVLTTPRTIRMVAVMERETMGMTRLVPSSVPNWEGISTKDYKLKKSE